MFIVLRLWICVALAASSWPSHYYSSNRVSIPAVPTAFQQISKLTGNIMTKTTEATNVVLECSGGKEIDWKIILITMVATVFAFWIGQFGMSCAARCPKWITKILIKCGLRKPKKNKKPRINKKKIVAGKFCVFPLRRNRQLIAHIREPMRSMFSMICFPDTKLSIIF